MRKRSRGVRWRANDSPTRWKTFPRTGYGHSTIQQEGKKKMIFIKATKEKRREEQTWEHWKPAPSSLVSPEPKGWWTAIDSQMVMYTRRKDGPPPHVRIPSLLPPYTSNAANDGGLLSSIELSRSRLNTQHTASHHGHTHGGTTRSSSNPAAQHEQNSRAKLQEADPPPHGCKLCVTGTTCFFYHHWRSIYYLILSSLLNFLNPKVSSLSLCGRAVKDPLLSHFSFNNIFMCVRVQILTTHTHTQPR